MTRPRIIPLGDELPPMEPALPSPALAARGTPKETPGGRPPGGRFAEINAFLDRAAAELDRAEMLVWLLLWRDTKPDGLASASQVDLARRAGINPRTVRRALENLKARGLIKIVRRGGIKSGVSIYRAHSSFMSPADPRP